jgi:copper resistance protein C
MFINRAISRNVQRGGLLAMLVLFSLDVTAHTGLKESVPGDGTTVATAPSEVKLVFTGPVALMKFALLTATDQPVTVDFKAITDTATEFALAIPSLASGQFKVNWTAVGADGHALNGSLVFTVNASVVHGDSTHADNANHADRGNHADHDSPASHRNH